jgi:hypothetical protein
MTAAKPLQPSELNTRFRTTGFAVGGMSAHGERLELVYARIAAKHPCPPVVVA